MNKIKAIKLNIFKQILSQITQSLKFQRNKYYFIIFKDGEKNKYISDEIYIKWEKLERYFDMFYEIQIKFEEILKLSKGDE